MYITIDAMYFHGHLFGRTRTFHIPFAGVQLFLSNSDGNKNIRISNGALFTVSMYISMSIFI